MQKIITLFSSHNNKLNLSIMLTIIFFNALNVYFLRTDVIVLLLTYTLIPLAFVFKYPSSRQISKAQLVKKHTKKFVNANGELITNMPSSWYGLKYITWFFSAFIIGVSYKTHFLIELLSCSLPAIILMSYLIKINCPYSILYINFTRKEYISIFDLDPEDFKSKGNFSSSQVNHNQASDNPPINIPENPHTSTSLIYRNMSGNIYNSDR